MKLEYTYELKYTNYKIDITQSESNNSVQTNQRSSATINVVLISHVLQLSAVHFLNLNNHVFDM